MKMTYRSINDIAADVRANLKAEFPNHKFSVTIEKYSGGQSLNVALMSGPESPLDTNPLNVDYHGNPLNVDYHGNPRHHAQLNHYPIRRDQRSGGTDYLGNSLPDFYNNGVVLTESAWDMLRRVDEIANAENWDRSDRQSDYFDVNYYFHLRIGKWNKPFVVTPQKGGK
jgi:hypothetical protein